MQRSRSWDNLISKESAQSHGTNPNSMRHIKSIWISGNIPVIFLLYYFSTAFARVSSQKYPFFLKRTAKIGLSSYSRCSRKQVAVFFTTLTSSSQNYFLKDPLIRNRTLKHTDLDFKSTRYVLGLQDESPLFLFHHCYVMFMSCWWN